MFSRKSRSIRKRLIACFVLIVLSMIVADAVATWQLMRITAASQRLFNADETSLAVLRVHFDIDMFHGRMDLLAGSHDARQFASQATSTRQKFLHDVDRAQQLLAHGFDAQDAAISTALESLRVTFLAQLDSVRDLANLGEWIPIRRRLTTQVPDIVEFSSSLVNRVDQAVLEERTNALEQKRRAQLRLIVIVPLVGLLTLLSSAALGWYVFNTISAPLSELTAHARSLAEGEFQKQTNIYDSDELTVLGNAFNYAAQQLQKLYDDLRRNERELRGVVNTVPAHVWSASPDGTVDFVNERLLEFAGLTSDDVLGWNWESVLHPDDRATAIANWSTAVKDGRSIKCEIRVRRADGEYRWFLVRGVPLRGDAGNITKWYGSGIEIEALKRAEQERERLRQLQAELAHIHRVTTMGEFAASIAHETMQPISAASIDANTCLRWLGRGQPDIERVREAVSRIVQNITQASDIISRIRALFKKEEPQRECVDVNCMIGEIVSLVRSEAGRHAISIHTLLAPDLPLVMVDRVQFQQVFMNLVRNGIDAMNEVDMPGDLTIKSQRKANQLLISIRDTGIGLPHEQADRVFEAFFTTKPQGTGMGLSICRSIIESHGGRLWATGNPDRGTTFQFTLPVERAATAVVA